MLDKIGNGDFESHPQNIKKKIDLKKKCIKRNFDEKLLNLQNPF